MFSFQTRCPRACLSSPLHQFAISLILFRDLSLFSSRGLNNLYVATIMEHVCLIYSRHWIRRPHNQNKFDRTWKIQFRPHWGIRWRLFSWQCLSKDLLRPLNTRDTSFNKFQTKEKQNWEFKAFECFFPFSENWPPPPIEPLCTHFRWKAELDFENPFCVMDELGI